MIEPTAFISLVAQTVRPTVETVAPFANDVERFRLALANDAGVGAPAPAAAATDIAPASTGAIDPATAAPAAASQEGLSRPRTLGDAILQGLQSASNDITVAWRSTGEVLNKPDINMADMLRVQGMLLQSAVQYELVGKAVSKSTQSLENILKTQ